MPESTKPKNSKRHRYSKEVRDFCINARLVKGYDYESIKEAVKVKFPGGQIPAYTTIMYWCGDNEKMKMGRPRQGRDYGPRQEPLPPEPDPVFRGQYEITVQMPVMTEGRTPTIEEVLEQSARLNQMLLSREVQRQKSRRKAFNAKATKDGRFETK